MKTQSAKAKGRLGQQEVCRMILKEFPSLEPDDVRSTSMGAGGEDVLLSPKARLKFPFSIEVKRRKTFTTIYDWVKQAVSHDERYPPVVFFRGDREEWLVVLKAEDFIELVGESNGQL